MPPPLSYLEPTTTLPGPQNVEPLPDQEDVETEDNELEEPNAEGDILEDNEDDRTTDAELVGKKVRALYENGWFTGDVVYYNERLGEYKVDYDDSTSDYISLNDIDGVEVILQD